MNSNKPVVCITQARMTSSRLPGKIMKQVEGRELLDYHLTRLARSKNIDQLVVATTVNETDAPVVEFCRSREVRYFRGDENNVLERFYQCAQTFNAKTVVRVTSDCPLIDPEVVDLAIGFYCDNEDLDYVSLAGCGFPRGLDVEVFSFRALEMAHQKASEGFEKEHVTPYIYRNEKIFSCGVPPEQHESGDLRWCVDEQADFELVSRLLTAFAGQDNFSWKDCLRVMEEHPDWKEINRDVEQKKLGQ